MRAPTVKLKLGHTRIDDWKFHVPVASDRQAAKVEAGLVKVVSTRIASRADGSMSVAATA